MKLRDIIKQLDKDFPFSWAMEWDNIGLLVGDMEADINKVFLNLDVTDEAVAEASLWGADLILTHHPLLFSPARTVTEQDFIGRRIRRLIKEDINYIAMHTNFDIAKMADLNAADLQLMDPRILDVTGEDASGNPVGLGRVGEVPEMSLAAFAEIVKKAMSLQAVRVRRPRLSLINRCQRPGTCPYRCRPLRHGVRLYHLYGRLSQKDVSGALRAQHENQTAVLYFVILEVFAVT